MYTQHELKTLPEFFNAVFAEEKNFEVRKNDRDFKVGDTLLLREWSPELGYTQKQCLRTVNYILPGGNFGIDKDYCVLGFLMSGPPIPF